MPLTFGTPFIYDTLVADVGTEGSIRSWGSHAAIPSDQVLTEAQAWIYHTLRAREMIVLNEITINPNDTSMALPAGWISNYFIRLDGDSRNLTYKHESWVRFKQWDGTFPTGKPRSYTILDQVYWDIQADAGLNNAGYNGEMAFFGTPAPLGTGNESNFLCTKFPTLLRLVCTAFAYQSRRRLQDADDMFAMANVEMASAQMDNEEYRRGMLGLRGPVDEGEGGW